MSKGREAIVARLQRRVEKIDADNRMFEGAKPSDVLLAEARRVVAKTFAEDPCEGRPETKAAIENALRQIMIVIQGFNAEIDRPVYQAINNELKASGNKEIFQGKNPSQEEIFTLHCLAKAYQLRSEARSSIADYHAPRLDRPMSQMQIGEFGRIALIYGNGATADREHYHTLQSYIDKFTDSQIAEKAGSVEEAPKAPPAELLIRKGIKNFESFFYDKGLEKFKQVQGMGPESVTMLFDQLHKKRKSQSVNDMALWDSHLKEIVGTFTPEQKKTWRALKKVVVPVLVEEPAPVPITKVEAIPSEPAPKPNNAIVLVATDVTMDDSEGPWIALRKGKKLQQQDTPPAASTSAVSENTVIPRETAVPAMPPAVEFTEKEYPRLEKAHVPAANKRPPQTKAKKEQNKTATIPAEEKQPDIMVGADTVANVVLAVPSEKVSSISSNQMMQQPKREELFQDAEQARSFLRGLIGKDSIPPKERNQCVSLHHSSNLDIKFLVDAYRLREKNMLTKAERKLFDRRIFDAENPVLLSDARRQFTSDELELLRGLATSSPKPDNAALRQGFVDKYVDKAAVGASTQAVLDGRGGKTNDGRN